MAATTNFSGMSPGSNLSAGSGLYLTAAWQGIVGLVSLYSITLIWGMEADFNLSGVIQSFLTAIVTIFGVAALASALFIVRLNNIGRIVGMFVNLTGAVLGGLYLGHLLGLYIGVDALAEGIYRNVVWLVGIPVGYAIMWLSSRFDERSQTGFYLNRAGIGIIVGSLALLLWFAGLPAAAGSIIGALLQPVALVTVAIIVIFSVSAAFLLRLGDRFGETIEQREAWQGWLFLLPNFISFMIFFALPLLLSFYLSFTDYGRTSLTSANWVGFTNYGSVVNDPLFWQSFWTTVRYCLLLLLLSIPTALGLAMVLNAKIPGMKFFRAVYF
jgi:hypothetical protein